MSLYRYIDFKILNEAVVSVFVWFIFILLTLHIMILAKLRYCREVIAQMLT